MQHYKDSRPIGTIARIRDILSRLDLLPTERWLQTSRSVHATRLTIPGIEGRIGVNGKGLSPAFSLASAYGEFMERLQNQILYPLFFYYEFDRTLRKRGGFLFDPRERLRAPDEIEGAMPVRILESLLPGGGPGRLLRDSTSDFLRYGDRVACVDFYEVATGTLTSFPLTLAYYCYGSNGMCAGNTPEEALVQGFSEIFERYVNRQFLLTPTTPPTIDRGQLKQSFPNELQMIEEIEARGDIEVRIKDCSLGRGLPVIAAVFYRRNENGYFVKFGAHPDLHVALERALLELFQGRIIDRFEDLVPFEVPRDDSVVRSEGNFHRIYVTGAGMYPLSFFEESPSYAPTTADYERTFADNGACLQFLLRLVREEGWDPLVRSVDFLGFPSFEVIVPGVSELNLLSADELRFMQDQANASAMVKRLAALSTGEMRELAAFVERRQSLGHAGTLMSLAHLPLTPSSLWAKIDQEALLVILLHALDRQEPALQVIEGYLERLRSGKAGQDALVPYYKCARDSFRLALRGHEERQAKSILQAAYGKVLVDRVAGDFAAPGSVLRGIGHVTCPDCGECALGADCSYDEIRRIHGRIKDRLLQHPPDQGVLPPIFRPFLSIDSSDRAAARTQ